MGDFSVSLIAQRTMSDFALSIGTGMGLASLLTPTQAPYDPERQVPQRLDIMTYQEFWVNLRTLYRNLIGALPKDAEQKVMNQDLSDTLAFEVDLIQRLVESESRGQCKCVFYTSNYQDLARRHPHANLRHATTAKQIQYNSQMDAVLVDFFRQQAKSDLFAHYNGLISPKVRSKALIMTHYAYDLLAKEEFSDLHLLESHTGAMKEWPQWHTKLSGGKDLVNIPFNAACIQIFGDSQTFAPLNQKAREQVKELAVKFKWTSVSSRERVMFSFGQMSDIYAGQIYKQMLQEV